MKRTDNIREQQGSPIRKNRSYLFLRTLLGSAKFAVSTKTIRTADMHSGNALNSKRRRKRISRTITSLKRRTRVIPPEEAARNNLKIPIIIITIILIIIIVIVFGHI